jgi:hypothetical protein
MNMMMMMMISTAVFNQYLSSAEYMIGCYLLRLNPQDVLHLVCGVDLRR